MKVRNGFVSNSSSSSFIISKQYLYQEQIDKIRNHIEENNKVYETGEVPGLDLAYDDDYWSIDENEYNVSGSTFMDNFSMYSFFKYVLHLNMKHVKWSD